jgi:RNA polymerase sigma factor (sigma-70 family)
MDHTLRLWENMTAGNEDAFKALYLSQVNTLFSYGMVLCSDSSMVQDALQDVFSSIWQKKEDLPEIQQPAWYLQKSLRNRLLRMMEQNRRFDWNEELILPSEPWEESLESAWIQEGDATEKISQLRRALHELPTRQHEALHLRYFEGHDYPAIASLLDMEQQSVYNLVFRALQNLRKQFKTKT